MTTPGWLWALGPMLLAAAIVVPVLGRDIFDVDEAATMISACAHHLGPCSPAEAIRASAYWPDQVWGQAIAFSQWGRLVGWSEFAIRALPWLTGTLTIAWIYRLGRDLFSPAIALGAALLLSTSVLFLIYMHNARFYGPSMLFTTITLWGYWRVSLANRRPDRAAQVALITGATGVLYSHYFGALLIPALGLFHLFFVRKGRRWYQSTILLALATLLALPQVPDLLNGIAFNQGKTGLHAIALDTPEILFLFFLNLSNGVLHVPYPLNSLLLLAPALLLLLAVRLCRNRHFQPNAGWYMTTASVLLGFLMLAANQWMKVLAPGRVRYLASLWPPALLLFSVAIHNRLREPLRKLALVSLALIAFTGAADFLWVEDLTSHSWSSSPVHVTIPVINRIAAEASPDSLLLADPLAFGWGSENFSYELYTGVWGNRAVPLFPDSLAAELVDQARDHQEVWLLYLTASEDKLQIPDVVNHLAQEGWVELLDWQDGRVTLQHLRSP